MNPTGVLEEYALDAERLLESFEEISSAEVYARRCAPLARAAIALRRYRRGHGARCGLVCGARSQRVGGRADEVLPHRRHGAASFAANRVGRRRLAGPRAHACARRSVRPRNTLRRVAASLRRGARTRHAESHAPACAGRLPHHVFASWAGRAGLLCLAPRGCSGAGRGFGFETGFRMRGRVRASGQPRPGRDTHLACFRRRAVSARLKSLMKLYNLSWT